LARLYIGWAKRAPTSEETTEYIAKAEEVINEGLKVVKVGDGLWIESGKFSNSWVITLPRLKLQKEPS